MTTGPAREEREQTEKRRREMMMMMIVSSYLVTMWNVRVVSVLLRRCDLSNMS